MRASKHVDERMQARLQEGDDCSSWTCLRWATYLDCGAASVVGCLTWLQLAPDREAFRQRRSLRLREANEANVQARYQAASRRVVRDRCVICGRRFRRRSTSHRQTCGDDCRRELAVRHESQPSPTPDEIVERCLIEQANWSEAERLSRIRCDWRELAVMLHRCSVTRERRQLAPC